MISIFTPTHKPKRLLKAMESLRTQTNTNFEWIICINNTNEKLPKVITETMGEKVKVTYVTTDKNKIGNIGFLKKLCCGKASGTILLELDHDDALEPNCLQEVANAFADPAIDFVYSSWFEYDKEGKCIKPFSESYGWNYSIAPDGRFVTHAMKPSAASFGYIWYAPNHVRAWRKAFYTAIGGHDETMDVCDDHDLCCRTYIEGQVKFIPLPLYQYHATGENTSATVKNKKIQEVTVQLHDKYIERLALKWCALNELKPVDVCCHTNKPAGFIGIDAYPYEGVDVVHDLNITPWPFADGSVGLFRMQDALEHLKDAVATMKELHRCLAPGGMVLIEVPSTDGRGAFQDPTHVSFWNANSFWYYTNAQTAKYINTPVKFQQLRILDYYPSEWHEVHKIPYVKSHLVKLVDDVVPPGGRNI